VGDVNRLYDVLRRHPTTVDGFWACVLLVTSLAMIGSTAADSPGSPYFPSRWLAVVAAVALSAVVLLRRRAPNRALGLAFGTGVFQVAADVPPMPGNFAFLVIIYTVATLPPRLPSRLALAGGLASPVICELRWPTEVLDGDGSRTSVAVGNVLFLTVASCLAWVLGDSLRTRRAYYAELEERATRLERERATQARMAVAAERARIARELHDVVAHNVSAMIVQADGAAYVLESEPEQAKSALRTISDTGRQALTEMRRLLGVLRGEDGEATSQDYVPQPGVEQLAELIDQVRDTGLPVTFRIEGRPRPLPTGVELTAYRIVQEALTNTRKHGGPHAGATVRLEYTPDALTVLAEDDGQGSPLGRHEERGADGRGHGLIGMRERVGMVGGVLVAGPRPGGGFRISATLPLDGGD
jgi:signal transduction histidine kinase